MVTIQYLKSGGSSRARTSKKRLLCVTLGDPDALGPELACRELGKSKGQDWERTILLIGPESSLRWHCLNQRLNLFWTRLDCLPVAGDLPLGRGVFLYEPEELRAYIPAPGKGRVEGGRAAGVSLETACQLAMQHIAAAVVTMPLSKSLLREAGYLFPGNTEFLAHQARMDPEEVCMHLAGPTLRVSLVTTHPPIRQVPEQITVSKIVRCLELTSECLLQQGLDGSIGVCGLNPHAGEQGLFGSEELEIIGPAVELAREHGVAAVGPLAGDSIFRRAANGEFTAVLAMYHDQGLAPLKLADFGKAVNLTLGLPFVRTSVDHGTGYELVGKNAADSSSFRAALRMAHTLS